MKECMESYAVTRRFLLYHMTNCKIMRHDYRHTHTRCQSSKITAVTPMLGPIFQPELALSL